MNEILRGVLLGIFILTLAACASRSKSSSHIYEGDSSPSINLSREREAAGGPLGQH